MAVLPTLRTETLRAWHRAEGQNHVGNVYRVEWLALAHWRDSGEEEERNGTNTRKSQVGPTGNGRTNTLATNSGT